MAVTDVFLDGAVTANTTIQPSSGTIYTFKRGNINVPSGAYVYITTRGGVAWAYGYAGGILNSFQTLQFTEAGATVYWSSAANSPYNPNSTPFSAISNVNYITLMYNTGTIYYTLVGASLT